MTRRAKTLSPRAHADALVEALSGLYSAPEWTLLTQVRSHAAPYEVLRIADAIAVRTTGAPEAPIEVHGFEAKRSRSDWLRELSTPEKSGPFVLFCAAFSLVVPAPWKRVVLALSELPDGWGLVEVAGSRAELVVAPRERAAEAPLPDFTRALFRAAQRPAVSSPAAYAPMVPVTRPHLGRGLVGCAGGHAVPSLAKVAPAVVACFACGEGRPADVEVLEAAIEEASAEDLERLTQAVIRRGARQRGAA